MPSLVVSSSACVRLVAGDDVMVSRHDNRLRAAWDLDTRHPVVTGSARSGDMMFCLPRIVQYEQHN